MLFYLIRHGDPDYEHDTLTPLGWRQAEALAHRFAGHGLDRIYASPLKRAQDTAKPTSELLKLPIEIEEWASEELAWQDIAGTTKDGNCTWAFYQPNIEIRSEENLAYTGDTWSEAPCFAMTPRIKKGFARVQAASDDFFVRQGYVRDGLKYKNTRPNNDRVALFCHQGFSMEFLPILLGIPPQYTFGNFDFTHCCVSIFDFGNQPNGYTQPRCLCLSDISHIYEARLPMKYNCSIDI